MAFPRLSPATFSLSLAGEDNAEPTRREEDRQEPPTQDCDRQADQKQIQPHVVTAIRLVFDLLCYITSTIFVVGLLVFLLRRF